MEFFIPLSKTKVKLVTPSGFSAEFETNSTIVNKLDLLNYYWNYFYQNCPKFKDYVEHLPQKDNIGDAIDEVYEFVLSYLNIKNWCNTTKRTKTSVFIDEEESKKIVKLLVALLVSFPFLFITNEGLLDYILTEYRSSILKLMDLAMSRIKFDSFKSYSVYYNTLVNPEIAFLTNFCFVLFSLTACSPVFMPEGNAMNNFFGYFVSVLSENQRFIIQSFTPSDIRVAVNTSDIAKKEISYNMIDYIYSSLVVYKIFSRLTKLQEIRSCYPTPLSECVAEILNISLEVSDSVLSRYILEAQYTFYVVAKKNKVLTKALGTSLELLSCAAASPKPVRKQTSDLPIITALMSRDISYLNVLVRKINKLNKIKTYQLVKLTEPTKQVNFPAINKMLTDFVKFYTEIVVDENRTLIEEIQRSFREYLVIDSIEELRQLQTFNF